MSALAALAAHGLDPAAGLMLTQVWQKRYLGQIRPCLANLGAGGGWFEGNTPGARAGLELVLFALAVRSATGERGPGQMSWFSDRLSYLLFRLLPGLSKSPTGNYRPVAPGGDEVLDPLEAAELTRMQMMGLLSLRPDDRSAGGGARPASGRPHPHHAGPAPRVLGFPAARPHRAHRGPGHRGPEPPGTGHRAGGAALRLVRALHLAGL